jgi:hypothetical protein
MQTRQFFRLFVLAAMFSLVAAPAYAQDDELPAGGLIAFISDRDGDAEIYVIDADGSNLRQLTDGDADDWGAAWQPAAAGAGSAEPTPTPDPSK